MSVSVKTTTAITFTVYEKATTFAVDANGNLKVTGVVEEGKGTTTLAYFAAGAWTQAEVTGTSAAGSRPA